MYVKWPNPTEKYNSMLISYVLCDRGVSIVYEVCPRFCLQSKHGEKEPLLKRGTVYSRDIAQSNLSILRQLSF